MKRVIATLALLTLGAVGGQSLEAHAPPGYTIVVSAQNPISSLTREQAAKLFLKKVSTWQDGRDAMPVDQPESSPVRDAFTKDVLRKTVPAVRAYWQQQIFSGRAVPPTERPSDAEVLAFVRANPNAVGYVSASTSAGEGTKVVDVREK